MTLMLLPDLPKGVRPLVTPIVDTADAAFVMSLDCQFLVWGSRASGGHLKNSRFWEIAAGDRVGAEVEFSIILCVTGTAVHSVENAVRWLLRRTSSNTGTGTLFGSAARSSPSPVVLTTLSRILSRTA